MNSYFILATIVVGILLWCFYKGMIKPYQEEKKYYDNYYKNLKQYSESKRKYKA